MRGLKSSVIACTYFHRFTNEFCGEMLHSFKYKVKSSCGLWLFLKNNHHMKERKTERMKGRRKEGRRWGRKKERKRWKRWRTVNHYSGRRDKERALWACPQGQTWGGNHLKLVPDHHHQVIIITCWFVLKKVISYMQAYFCGPIASLTLTPKLAVGKGSETWIKPP